MKPFFWDSHSQMCLNQAESLACHRLPKEEQDLSTFYFPSALVRSLSNACKRCAFDAQVLQLIYVYKRVLQKRDGV